MTREELLSLLEKMIPSFHRKWNEFGGNICDEKYGFLYNDETFLVPTGERIIMRTALFHLSYRQITSKTEQWKLQMEYIPPKDRIKDSERLI